MLVTDGLAVLEGTALIDPLPTLPGRVAAALAAATLRRFPVLGRFERTVPMDVLTRSRSARFKNGLGRFSSFDKSYCTGGCRDVMAATFDNVAPCSVLPSVVDLVVAPARVDEEVNSDDSDEEAGRVAALQSGGRDEAELRIDGLRRRVGGTLDTGDGSLVEFDP